MGNECPCLRSSAPRRPSSARHWVVNRQNFQPRGGIQCLPEEGAALEMRANQHLSQRVSRDACLFAQRLDLLHRRRGYRIALQ